jgi:fructose-specific phosphotransferase system IIC component
LTRKTIRSTAVTCAKAWVASAPDVVSRSVSVPPRPFGRSPLVRLATEKRKTSSSASEPMKASFALGLPVKVATAVPFAA